MPTTVRRTHELPSDLALLAARGRAEGFSFVDRLIAEWQSGANRFDAPGELFLCAWVDQRLAGFGGLNRDPYYDEADAGRVRHVYVEPDARRRGVGALLVGAIVEQARESFSILRLRTRQAAPFYERLGFTPIGEPDATHRLYLS